MRLAFLGTPPIAATCLTALAGAGHEIACVYSQPPRPRGRGQALRPSPVHETALKLGLNVRTPVSMRDPDEVAAFAALDLDTAVVVAYGQILPGAVLDAPRLGSFNLHASLLPRWRGAAPIQRAILAGDAVTGVQVMRMTEGLDEGPILASRTLPIGALDTAGTLFERVSIEGAALLVETLATISSGQARQTPQENHGVTYAKKITAAEGHIDWSRPAADVDHLIRGLSPFPGAWFEVPSDSGPVRIKALLSQVEDGWGVPGEVLDDRLLIACSQGAVRLLKAQREGRAAQDAADFLRGFALPAGAKLA